MTVMSNSRLLGILYVLLIIYLFSFPAYAQYGGGAGEPNDPYLIYTAEQMNAIGAEPNDWNKHFKLMMDIDLSGFIGTPRKPYFNIIGYFMNDSDNKPFTGVFDGNGKKISNFNYTSQGVNNIGLFGYINDPNALIKDLGLINLSIDIDIDTGTGKPVGSKYVGSLVGYFWSGTITNCYARGGSVSGRDFVGGLVGENNRGTITNCYSNSSVSGTTDVGGLVGSNYGTIVDCYSTDGVSGILKIGGLVGYNGVGTITNSYSNADVLGNQEVGGLVGLNQDIISNCYAAASVMGNGGGSIGGLVGRNQAKISDCYSTGSITGFLNVGGLVGKNNRGVITNCYSAGRVKCYQIDPVAGCQEGGLIGISDVDTVYNSFWDIQTSGQSTSARGIGKTTSELKMKSTFIGWWCGSFWTIDERRDYPRLWWENKHGETLSQSLSDFVAGSGEPNDPYLIYTADQLNTIGLFWCHWDKHFELMEDIDLSGYTGTDFNIIGTNGWPFTGIFDGNGHTISNFTYNSTGRDYIGLFGYVENPNAEIKNLGLINCNVDAGSGTRVGSLVGRIWNGTITNCYADGGSVSSSSLRGYVGGLVGINGVEQFSNATITNCYATADVIGERYVGGLVGYNLNTVTNCYATGDVTGGDKIGGLVGDNGCSDDGCIITNCYATGNVSGETQVGGLVGRNGFVLGPFGTFQGNIFSCYSTGTVLGTEDVGGLVGLHESGTIIFSFWDIQTSGQTTSAGGMGKKTTEMKTEDTFIDAGWDFVGETENGTYDIWWILEGQDYPRLRWELITEN